MKYFGSIIGAVLATFLASCGGGGSGGGGSKDLEVTLSYPLAGNLLVTEGANVTANITGMEGIPPKCRISGGALPDGMTINAGNCNISGTPSKVGEFVFKVEISANGYQGSVQTDFALAVLAPSPSYGWAGARSVIWGVVFLPDKPTIDYYNKKTGDAIEFILKGSLPDGLQLNTATGVISGTATSFGSYQPDIELNVTRNGATFTKSTGSSMMEVSRPIDGIHYDLKVMNVGMPVQLPFSYTDSSFWDGDIKSFGLIEKDGCPASLPDGLELDASSGNISGTPTSAFNTCVGVRLHYRRGIYTADFDATAQLNAQ